MLQVLESYYSKHGVSTRYIPNRSNLSSTVTHQYSSFQFKSIAPFYQQLSEQHEIVFKAMFKEFFINFDKEIIEQSQKNLSHRNLKDLKNLKDADIESLYSAMMKVHEIKFIQRAIFNDNLENIYRDRLKFNAMINEINSRFRSLKPSLPPMLFTEQTLKNKEIASNYNKLLCSGFINGFIRNNQSKNIFHFPSCIELLVTQFYKISFYDKIVHLIKREMNLIEIDEDFMDNLKEIITKYRNMAEQRNVFNVNEKSISWNKNLSKLADKFWMKDLKETINNIFVRKVKQITMNQDFFESYKKIYNLLKKFGAKDCIEDISKSFKQESDLWKNQYLSNEINITEYTIKMMKKRQQNGYFNAYFEQFYIPSYISAVSSKKDNYQILVENFGRNKLKAIHKLIKKHNNKEGYKLNEVFLEYQNVLTADCNKFEAFQHISSEHRILFGKVKEIMEELLIKNDERMKDRNLNAKYQKIFMSYINGAINGIIAKLSKEENFDIFSLIKKLVIALSIIHQIVFIKNSFFCADLDEIAKERIMLDSELLCIEKLQNLKAEEFKNLESVLDSQDLVKDRNIMNPFNELLCSAYIKNQTRHLQFSSIPCSLPSLILQFYQQSYYDRFTSFFEEEIESISLDEKFTKKEIEMIISHRNFMDLHKPVSTRIDRNVLCQWAINNEWWMTDITERLFCSAYRRNPQQIESLMRETFGSNF